MAESQTGDDDPLTFETAGGTETVTVPETFTRDDLSGIFGSPPREWDTEVVYIYDGVLRAAAVVDGELVEAMYADSTHSTFNEPGRGWIVQTAPDADGTSAADAPGETLWTADDD